MPKNETSLTDRCPGCGFLVSEHHAGGCGPSGCDISRELLQLVGSIRFHPSDLLVDEARFEKADREEMRECQ